MIGRWFIFHAPQWHDVLRRVVRNTFNFLLQSFARAGQPRHHSSYGNVEHFRGVRVGEILDGNKQQHRTLVVGSLASLFSTS